MTFILSPLNYIGGKGKLLPQLLPHFPKHINTFVDLFAGGLNVAINIEANKYICNDINNYVIDMYKYFQLTPIDGLLSQIHGTIYNYGLTTENEDAFHRLRDDYNATHSPLLLFLLICYGFNNQIRFNSHGGFNNTFGRHKSYFNPDVMANLCAMVPKLKPINFTSLNFKAFDYHSLTQGDFIYADPPYLISCGAYNDGKRGFDGWSADDDKALFDILDFLDWRGVSFALSNVTHHKGMVNQPLIEWASHYNVHHLVKNYKNANYQAKKSMTAEILVTNY